MAYGSGKGWWRRSYGDRNRDGIDDDYDTRPGSDDQSPEYARRYDYGSTTEYTPYGVERSDQIQAANIARENARRMAEHDARLSAQQKVHFWPNVGKFIVPDNNSWAAHAELVKDDKGALNFDPEKYLYFDKIIAENAGIPALYDRNHPDYAKYEGLRTNLEVLRNDIMGIYMNDGSFDPGDEVYIPQLQSIAQAIAESLSRDVWYKRAMGYQSINIDIANIEGVGAAAIYEHLLTTQKQPAPLQSMRDRLNDVLGLPQDRIWQLPPLEETPFSPANLSAPPPKVRDCLTMDDMERQRQEQLDQAQSASQSMSDLAEKITTPIPTLPVAELEEATKSESVEEARKILRNLRNLEFGNHDIEEWLDMGTPKAQMAKADALYKLAHIHNLQMQLAEARNPGHVRDMFTEDGTFAADAVTLALAEFALRNLPKNHPKVPRLEQLVFGMPEHAHARLGQSAERLLDNISTGLERATGKQVYDRTPGERLVSMSNRIQKTARKMRSIETLDPPARMESLALAHDILRRLKDMEMSRKPLDQFIETGKPDEKAAMAQKIDEVVDMYKNLVSEAATINPELMKDARIQEGVEAVSEFAHTVKLMAAKEIPNSVASAQQIGADVTQDPKEWDRLHDRTIERIVTSMEGGLEEAVDTIEVQEQQQEEQAEEAEREAAAEAALHYSHGHRRKRKRWARSGLGGKRQEKLLQEIRADDRVLGQGIYQDDRVQARGRYKADEEKSGVDKQQQLNMKMMMDDRIQGQGRFRDDTEEKSGLNKQQQLNLKHMMDDRIQGQGSYRDDEQRRPVSKNTRASRSGRRAAEQQQQQERMEAEAKQARAAAREQERNSTDAKQSAGNNQALPRGMNPHALASLQQALKNEGNTLLNMNRQAASIPPATIANNPARTDDTSNVEREQQRQGTTTRPRGNERL